MAGGIFKAEGSKRAHGAVPLALLLIVIVLAAAGLGIGFHQQIKNQLNAWKVLPQPERLTELYFTHPNNMPTTFRPYAEQTVSFTVHNIEYRTVFYNYEIIESTGQGNISPETMHDGTFTLQQNQYKNVNVKVPIMNLGSRVKVTIHLTNTNESIDYWLTRSSS